MADLRHKKTRIRAPSRCVRGAVYHIYRALSIITASFLQQTTYAAMNISRDRIVSGNC